MTKQTFVNTIKAIQNHMYDADKLSDVLYKLDIQYHDGRKEHLLFALFDLLVEEFNDKDNRWIEYFIYELDFGKKYKNGSVTEEVNGKKKNINLSTSEKLYDFLIKEDKKYND